MLKRRKKLLKSAVLCGVVFFSLWISCQQAMGQLVNPNDVRTSVLNWLNLKSEHFGENLGENIQQIELYRGGISGNIGYYLVILDQGWILLPADDRFWPIQVFGVGKMTSERFKESFWYSITSYSGELDEIQAHTSSLSKAQQTEISYNQKAWSNLKNIKTGDIKASATFLPSNSDVRVRPFLKDSSQWGQEWPFNQLTNFYNLNTTYLGYNQVVSDEQYPVGCVALAIGQSLHHIMTSGDFDFTDVSLTAGSPLGQQNLPFTITRVYIDSVNPNSADYYPSPFTKDLIKNPNLLSHNWTSMQQYVGTENSTPQSMNNAAIISNDIAPLLHDLGLMLKMNYSKKGSGAYLRRNVFMNMGFQEAAVVRTPIVPPKDATSTQPAEPAHYTSLNQSDKDNIINTNLDIGLPVIVEIDLYDSSFLSNDVSVDAGLHAAVVDGYAYASNPNSFTVDYEKPYYHVSTGWASYWYSTITNSVSWEPEPGAWSYGLEVGVWPEIPNRNVASHDKFVNIGVAFNLIPSVAAFEKAGNSKSTRMSNFGDTQGEIVSGRVLLMDFSNNETVAPVPGAIVTVSWEGEVRHTVTTNEKGIYAFLVPCDSSIELNVTSPDNTYLPIVKEISKTITPYEYLDLGIPADTIQYSIGNIWGLDFIPNAIIALPNDSENVVPVIESWFDNTQYPGQIKNYGIITKEDLANPDFQIPNVKVLVLGSDWDYSWTSDANITTAYNKILTWVYNGGTLLASGKSDNFVLGMGASKGLSYFNAPPEDFSLNNPFLTGDIYNYGMSTSMTHAVQSSLVSAIGASSIQMESDLMRQEQTVVWSYGSSIALRTIAQYVFMYRRTDPVEQYTYWDGYVQVHPTTIDFLYGDGRVMFVNNKITAFHSSGVPGKKYIELLISWLESFYDQMHSSQSQAMKDTVKARAMSDDFLTSRLATAVNATSLPRGMRDNVFYHQAGDNRTRVSETKVNKLSFGTWITPDDIKVLQIDDDLVLSVKGTSDRVTVPGWFKGISNVSDVVFENGTTLSTARIRELAVLSEPEIESTPVAVDSRTAGTKERDTLVGRDGANEMFVGLEGDDTIIGKGGRKVYYYRIGDGHDTLILSKKLEEDRNALRFDMAITSKDLQVSRSGEDLVIGVKDGSIKIEEWYKDTASRRLDRVEFITGEVWDSRDLEKLASGKELSTREYYIDMGNAKFEELLGSANPEVQPEDTPESAETPSGGGCNAGVSVMCGLVAIVVAITNRSKIRQ